MLLKALQEYLPIGPFSVYPYHRTWFYGDGGSNSELFSFVYPQIFLNIISGVWFFSWV